jgi:hypothetical protein
VSEVVGAFEPAIKGCGRFKIIPKGRVICNAGERTNKPDVNYSEKEKRFVNSIFVKR